MGIIIMDCCNCNDVIILVNKNTMEGDNMKNKKGQGELGWTLIIGIFCLFLIVGVILLYQPFKVWSRELSGKASLKEAEWDRQIAVEEAKAELESAELKKEADIIRAEGIAEANKIISKSLTTQYLRWLWIKGLQDGSSEIIYIPTEAGIPIMEARNK